MNHRIPRFGARHGIIGRVGQGQEFPGYGPQAAGPMGPVNQGMYFQGDFPYVAEQFIPPVPVGCDPFSTALAPATRACLDAGTDCRVYPLNFRQDAVAASATVTLTSRPQKTFRPTKIVAPSSIADKFVLTSLQIGTNPQIVDNSGAGTLLQVFSEAAQDVGVMFDLAQVGIDISLQVQNIDAAQQNFFLTLLGPSVDNRQL